MFLLIGLFIFGFVVLNFFIKQDNTSKVVISYIFFVVHHGHSNDVQR
jgi:hypothetical protein